MTLKDELQALRPLLGTDSPEFYDRMKDIASRHTSDDDKKLISDLVSERLQEVDREIDSIEENAIKLLLQEGRRNCVSELSGQEIFQ